MGGISDGQFQITHRKTLEFFGTLPLANGGGFASVRTKAKTLDLRTGDSLLARLRGDGRDFTVNLYLPSLLTAFSYRAPVHTKKGEWIEVRLPLDGFVAASFGRPVKDAGPVDPPEVHALGFMVRDKKAGPFTLEVERVKVEQAGSVTRPAPGRLA